MSIIFDVNCASVADILVLGAKIRRAFTPYYTVLLLLSKITVLFTALAAFITIRQLADFVALVK
jgi:hypothetical protein